jgi:hypothetical protein
VEDGYRAVESQTDDGVGHPQHLLPVCRIQRFSSQMFRQRRETHAGSLVALRRRKPRPALLMILSNGAGWTLSLGSSLNYAHRCGQTDQLTRNCAKLRLRMDQRA